MSRLWIVFVWAAAPVVHAQGFSHRGFLDISTSVFPQIVANDRAHVVATGLVRYEPKWQPKPWIILEASFEARTDTHHEVSRSLHLDRRDRSLERPALSVRRLSAVLTTNNLTMTIGKQFIRWGEADFLNPTDRFAPKDLLTIIDQDVSAVTAVRLTYAKGDNTFDFVWQPWFTPGRIPLTNQRWTFLPAAFDGARIEDQGSLFPGRSMFGARWSHTAGGYEYSLSYYDGFNYLPSLSGGINAATSSLNFLRIYPALRLYGGDLAIPLSCFTLKGEGAYYTSPDKRQDEYAIYVFQLQRQFHDLGVMFGYAGEVVTTRSATPQFSGERGFTRALIGHAQYALSNRTFSVDAFVRQNGKGSLITPGLSQSFGDHWRGTISFSWLRGEEGDFLGQYHRNSFAMAQLRYSF
jgi:hypothetical protein